MSTKLDYLSKYTLSSAATNDVDDKRDKKQKKKKKQKKNKKDLPKRRKKSTMCVNDDGETYRRFTAGSIGIGFRDDDGDDLNNDLINDNRDDDEIPVIVKGAAATLFNDEDSSRGVWKMATTDKKSNSNHNTNEHLHRRRKRHDSSSSDDIDGDRGKEINSNTNTYNAARKQRDDSPSDDDDEDENKKINDDRGRRQRCYDYDLDSDSDKIGIKREKQQKQYGYDDEKDNYNCDDGRRTVRQRHDSDIESVDGDSNRQPTKKRRHDSDDSDENNDDDRERMPSGHKAGLQQYEDFNRREQKLHKQKRRDAQKMIDKYGTRETVYRDKDGKKTVYNNDKMGGKLNEEASSDSQLCLNQGKVQKMSQIAMAKEMLILQNSTFARRQDDERLEELRKNEIRKDDPMAQYALMKQQKYHKNERSQQQHQQQVKTYKGPPPKANRFGIRPGYRWDGVDRGNGFEDKILAKKFSTNRKQEQAYHWRSADM